MNLLSLELILNMVEDNFLPTKVDQIRSGIREISIIVREFSSGKILWVMIPVSTYQ